MKTIDIPAGANTNKAPKGVRDKTYKYFGVSKAEYEAAQRTIPAEKPTAIHTEETQYERDTRSLQELCAERDRLQAQAAQLAEALKCAEMVLAERGVELKEITRALANYESEVRQ